MRRTITLLALIVTTVLPAAAQDTASTPPILPPPVKPKPQKTFFVRSDLVTGGAILVGTGIVSIFDERIANWAQSESIQNPSRTDLAESLTFVNEAPLTIAAASTYVIGKLARQHTMADVGLHWTETMVATVAMSELIRVTVGRIRPRAAGGNAFTFEPGKGFSEFEARSFPSLHAAAAFGTASALSAEIELRNPDVATYARPLLYTAALVPGFTRIYLNEHWASDIVAGTFLGVFLGNRIVKYSHEHPNNFIDRALLATTIVPTSNGVMVMASLRR